MSVDWITIGSQLLNFLVLVWLLKRFLYRPILDGIDAREAEIATRMGESAAIRATAEAAEAKYKQEIALLRASRAGMLDEARRAAEAERDALLAEAHHRLTRELTEREEHRAQEAAQFTAALHHRGTQALLALTRKALADLADETLEHRIVAKAVGKMAGLADGLRKAAGDSHEIVALTRDPLPAAMQAQLREDLNAMLPGFSLRFEVSPDVSPGLSLRLGGAQVAWTLDSYLDGLDAALEGLSGRLTRKGVTDAA